MKTVPRSESPVAMFTDTDPAGQCWTLLSAELKEAYPQFSGAPWWLTAWLVDVLSVAWWIVSFAPELAEKRKLRLLVGGSSEMHYLDEGRWYQLLPWLLGKPQMHVEVVVLDDGLLGDVLAEFGEDFCPPTSDCAACVNQFTPGELFVGHAVDWVEQGKEAPDLIALFNPAFWDPNWLDASSSGWGLGRILRSQVPIAAFDFTPFDSIMGRLHLQAHPDGHPNCPTCGHSNCSTWPG